MKLFPYGIGEPALNIEAADKALDDYFAIAGAAGIRTCLAYGSCLGFKRDGGYIPGDNDLDVVAVADSLTPAFHEDLMAAGFNRGLMFLPPLHNVHYYRGKIMVDIFFRSPGEYYKEFDTVQYKDKTYMVPHPVEEYLIECYSDWKTPMEESGKSAL